MRKRIADVRKEEGLDKDSALLYDFWEEIFQLREKFIAGQDEDDYDESDSLACFSVYVVKFYMIWAIRTVHILRRGMGKDGHICHDRISLF